MANEQTGWGLDKKLSVTLIMALLIQAGSGIWWASGQTFQVRENTETIAELETEVDKAAEFNRDLLTKVVRLEERVSTTNELLGQILLKIEPPSR